MSRERVLCIFLLVMATGAFAPLGVAAWAEGTEILGPTLISVAGGTGIAVGGVGLIDQAQPQDIFVAVPPGARVTQVLLYWIDEYYMQTQPDDTVLVNGMEVRGTAVGGPVNFFSVVDFTTYRADITALGLVGPGGNTLGISGLDNSFRTTGAGVVVIYDDGVSRAHIELLDGQDLAYWRLDPPLDTTVPLRFAFEPAEYSRVATMPVLVGSVGDARPNVTEFVVGGAVHQIVNLFTSLDGAEWDSQLIDIEIPAGVSELSMQLLSEGDGTDRNPASMAWCVAGIVLESPEEPPEECFPCDGKVSQLTLRYLGQVTGALIEVTQKKEGAVFADAVAPGQEFTFVGIDKKGTLGTEISVFVNGELNTKIHTSCSQPIGPGMIKGDFLIVEGYSRNGGLLCPDETPDDPSDPPTYETFCDAGKPVRLTMVYTGDSCAASNHSQDADKVVCDGDPAGTQLVHIIAADKDDPNHEKARIFFDGEVALGQTFDIDAGITDLTRLRADTRVFVFGLDGILLQYVKFHTSCSQPLNPGDQFGSLQLTAFVAEGGVKALVEDEAEKDVLDKPDQLVGCYAGASGGSPATRIMGDAAAMLLVLVALVVWGRRGASQQI